VLWIRQGRKWGKLILALCCLCYILASLGSAGFIYSHLDHDCTGADCPVCVQIREAENFLRCPAGSAAGLCLAAAAFRAGGRLSRLIHTVIPPFSEITFKVRLNT
jgi:hypothetical protein